MPLRPYQDECLDAIVKADAEDCKRQLVVMPTGSGKTQIASHLPDRIELKPWESMTFMVQAEELAFQAVESLRQANPDLHVSLEKAEHISNEDADITVASVDSLATSEQRLERFANGSWRVVFLDEVHHAVSRKYLKVLKALHILKGEPDINPEILLCGLTATPRRHDGVALERILDKIVYRRGIREMVEQGWIVEPRAYRVDTGVDLDGLHMHNGDFAIGELSRTLNTPELNALVVRKYQEYGEGLPAIAYTVDIQHSEDLAATFRYHGLQFEAISGKTPKAKRKELVEAHRKMWLPGLCSCQALLEGFDSPPATVALFDRNTCSSTLYQQAVGRVMRPYPAPEARAMHRGYWKKHAILVDFVGVTSNHRLYTAATMFGLNPQFDMEGNSIIKTVEKLEELQRQNPTLDITAFAGLDDVEAAVYSVDLWQPASVPKLAKSCSQFLWVQAGEDLYRLSAPALWIYIERNHLGQYEVYQRQKGQRIDELEFSEPEDAFAYADSLVPPEQVKLVRRNARWRKEEPTRDQCQYLWKWDPVIRKRFGNGELFWHFALGKFQGGNQAFSKGGISQRIELCKQPKDRVVAQ